MNRFEVIAQRLREIAREGSEPTGDDHFSDLYVDAEIADALVKFYLQGWDHKEDDEDLQI